MTVTVHSSGSKIVLAREGVAPLVHVVPRKPKFFKEELRCYKEEICAWLCGKKCDVLIVYKPARLSFYRRALYQAIVAATQREDKLVLLITCIEEEPIVR